MANASWLLPGPGRNWQSATKSVNSVSAIQRRRLTMSSWKYPMCAAGPPKDVTPSLRNAVKSPSGEVWSGPKSVDGREKHEKAQNLFVVFWGFRGQGFGRRHPAMSPLTIVLLAIAVLVVLVLFV